MRRHTVVPTPEPDGGAANATVPALTGCFTWGEVVDRAPAMARDAIAADLNGDEAPPANGIAVVVTVESDDPVAVPA